MSFVGIIACSIIVNLVSLCWLWVIGDYAFEENGKLDWSIPKIRKGNSEDAFTAVVLTIIPILAPGLTFVGTLAAIFKYFARNPTVFIILVFISAVAALIFDLFHN